MEFEELLAGATALDVVTGGTDAAG